MSIFDKFSKAKRAAESAGGSQVFQMFSVFLEQQGGVSSLIDRFQKGGLTNLVSSWISTGQNLPIDANQIQKVLGGETVRKYAAAAGIDPTKASEQIAKYLPQIIDKLTPEGKMPAEGFDGKKLGQIMKSLLAQGDSHAA